MGQRRYTNITVGQNGRTARPQYCTSLSFPENMNRRARTSNLEMQRPFPKDAHLWIHLFLYGRKQDEHENASVRIERRRATHAWDVSECDVARLRIEQKRAELVSTSKLSFEVSVARIEAGGGRSVMPYILLAS